MFAPTTCSSVLTPLVLRMNLLQRGMDHRLVSAFDQAQRDPIADGGKVGAALGSAPQPAGDFCQHLASRGVDATELVVFNRDASGHVTLRGEFAEMRGEEIVPAVALQLLILQIHFNLLLKIVRGFPKRGPN